MTTMKITRAIFEKGIEVRLQANGWEISSAPAGERDVFPTIQSAMNALAPLRLVLISEKGNMGGGLTLLLRTNSKEFFGVCVSEIMNRPLGADTIYPMHHLQYLLGAVDYHGLGASYSLPSVG